MNEQFRVMVVTSTRSSSFKEPKDFSDFNEFVEYLEDEGISEFSLKFHSIIDDLADLKKDKLKPETVTDDDFKWLTEKVNGQSRFLEINRKELSPYVPEGKRMHPTLMPFKEKQVSEYFAPVSADKHLNYFLTSIKKYKDYENKSGKYTPDNDREFRQAEKDERFFTTRYFVALFERNDRFDKLKSLLITAFGDMPPFEKGKKYPSSWDSLLKDVTLTLESYCRVFLQRTP